MLPKRRRITRQLFPDSRSRGQVFHTDHLSLRITPSPALTHSRVSAVIAKKVAKTSVDRHTFKRRVYDAVTWYETKKMLEGTLLCFFAKKDAHTLSFSKLAEEVDELLSRSAGLSL